MRIATIAIITLSVGTATGAFAQTMSNPQSSTVSPVRGIDRDGDAVRRPREDRPTPEDIQTIDGSNNNLQQPLWGAAGTALIRRVGADYSDGLSALAGPNRASPRVISNRVHAQEEDAPNPFGYTDFLWQWGQFLDHDIDLTDGVEPHEPAPIAVPAGDPFFDPAGTGDETIDFNRSLYDPETGINGVPRQQINEISAWIDGSNVYGSDADRTAALRTLDGSGRLKTSEGNLLPFNTAGLPNAGGSGDNLFLAGDVRANEQVGLAVMHTLFVREHNRIADRIAANTNATGDEIFERARREVIAILQVITYREFLPALLGDDAIEDYSGYDPSANGSIRNEFSTAAYRLGHTLLSPTLLRLNNEGAEIAAGHLSLADAFFRPDRIVNEGGIDPVLRGLAGQVCQDIDVFVIDEVRNFLFGLPGSGGFDLASLNIQRGRDHGLASYNATRRAYGLEPARRFRDITGNQQVAQRLDAAYASPAQVDLWTGGLAEDRVPGAMVGPLFQEILVRQFTALRDGDRFWYERVFRGQDLRRLERTRLADVIRRNTSIQNEISDNVFRVAP